MQISREHIEAVERAKALINKRIRSADNLLAKWPNANIPAVTAGDFEDAARLTELAAYLRSQISAAMPPAAPDTTPPSKPSGGQHEQ